MHDDKRVQAAIKAAHTLRINLLEKADRLQVEQISREIISSQFLFDDDVTREGIIAREIGKTTWQSFCRFGDRRSTSSIMKLVWIDNKEVPLDIQAMYLSEQYGMDFSPEEFSDFMLRYDHGLATFPILADLANLKNTFKYLTGFHWNLKFVQAQILINSIDNQLIKDLPF